MSGQHLRVGVGVEVRVPASSANLGPGFDSVGCALGVWDTCRATVSEQPGLVVTVAGEGEGDREGDDVAAGAAGHEGGALPGWDAAAVLPRDGG